MTVAMEKYPALKNAAFFALAAIVPHIPCILAAAGIFGLGASVAAIFSNPFVIGAGVFLSLSSVAITRHFICRWRCDAENSCTNVGPNVLVTTRHTSLQQMRAAAVSARRNGRVRAGGFAMGAVTVSAASAMVLPRFLPQMHCHISHIDYTRSVLLSCPNGENSILVTVSPQNQIIFIDGGKIGAMRMEMCGGADQMWMPRGQPGHAVQSLSMREAGEIFREWSCCSAEKMTGVIETSNIDTVTKNAMVQAVQDAWLGSTDAVHCPVPQAITELGRER